ncbi:hypothetical protein CEXT_505001 [Caerostris extrusa]|uniref:Uncharacterized protein n=1 Tax=Caerostris extrusa TaxID=172846 RepID=A0AAV4PHN9_CAEEX|nr:hypothetical protein CEXT_505001 [Caerostris extrusa]
MASHVNDFTVTWRIENYHLRFHRLEYFLDSVEYLMDTMERTKWTLRLNPCHSKDQASSASEDPKKTMRACVTASRKNTSKKRREEPVTRCFDRSMQDFEERWLGSRDRAVLHSDAVERRHYSIPRILEKFSTAVTKSP